MYKRMLVPLDGSELAEVVFTYAKELAGRLDLDVVLLHVYGPEESALAPMHRAYVERAADIIRQQCAEVQRRTGAPPECKPVEARGELAMGYPAEEILRHAEKNGIDLILMATHGRSGVRRWVMGSVADKVLRASKVPVWLVRAGVPQETIYDQWPRVTILVPLDGSRLARAVIPHVETLAKQRGAELVDVILLRVYEPPMIIPSGRSPDMSLSLDKYIEKEVARRRAASEQYLGRIERRLKSIGIRARSEVLMGKPADEIIRYANASPFNLIAMATHGYSGVSRWALGSVAEKVMLAVTSPILLIRPRSLGRSRSS